MSAALLRLEGLTVDFPSASEPDPPPVVAGLELELQPGSVLGVVGESGSGKSQMALAILGLSRGRVRGRVIHQGRDLELLGRRARARTRGREIALVFQEPRTALDPLFRAGDQLVEVLRAHRRLARSEARARALELLAAVGLDDPEHVAASYPHQLSGGMCQRLLIAMATSAEPGLVIADEPTSALDTTVAARILDLLERRVRTSGASLILITHDLALVAGRADRIAVMADGRIVEQAPSDELLARPLHPATVALLRARSELAGLLDPELAPRTGRFGTGPGAWSGGGEARAAGCAHRARCPIARLECALAPPLAEALPGHQVACHFPGEERLA